MEEKEKLQQREVYWDCEEEIEDRVFQLLGHAKDQIQLTLATLKGQIDYVLSQMKLVGLKPNKIQTAIAIAVAHMTATPGLQGSKKNEMIVIPPAKGKTRIAMAVALLLLRKFEKASKVVVAFPN